MAKGPSDIGEKNMALKQENMASNQITSELNLKRVETSQKTLMPNRENRNREAAEMEAARLKEQETEAARLKGQETRRRNYEKRMEKQRLVALAAEEQRLRQRQKDEGFMREALRQAQKAAAIGDVPIGCVIVRGDKIIARGYNRRNADKSVLSHAEIISIKKACKKIGDWRLEDCTMYVTLEPCPMCAGAIVQARIPRIAVGCMNPKAGCAGSVLDMLHVPGFNHQAEVTEGVLGQECSKLMSDFFQSLRERKK